MGMAAVNKIDFDTGDYSVNPLFYTKRIWAAMIERILGTVLSLDLDNRYCRIRLKSAFFNNLLGILHMGFHGFDQTSGKAACFQLLGKDKTIRFEVVIHNLTEMENIIRGFLRFDYINTQASAGLGAHQPVHDIIHELRCLASELL